MVIYSPYDLKSESTLFSSTFKIEENKVPSDFRLDVSWQKYRHFYHYLFQGVGLFYIILHPVLRFVAGCEGVRHSDVM